jgi:hypothetical protein
VREKDKKKVPVHYFRTSEGLEPGCHSDHVDAGPNLVHQSFNKAEGMGFYKGIYNLEEIEFE